MKSSDEIKAFTVIDGGKRGKAHERFVCTGCGRTFAARWMTPRKTKAEAMKDPPSLEKHWLDYPEHKPEQTP